MLISQLLKIAGWTTRMRVKSRRLSQPPMIEGLEVRSLPTGFAWADATSLTISFAPDGTDVAGNQNELNADLQHLGTPAEWQATIVSAFQTWLNELGFSISVVNDSGACFGTNGATHGDSRFGDVRVGAVPLTPGVLATAIPQTAFISGTWAGDMMLNSTVELTSLDELYALSLHEAGHILGLEHSIDPSSPMFDHGGTTVLPPTTQDLTFLRNLYGKGSVSGRSVEMDDSLNGSADHAERIAAVEANGMFPRFEVSGTILDASDVDTFVFRPREASSESQEVTSIILRTTSPGLIPRLSLTKLNGQKVEYTVVANGNGLVILQSRDLEADADYIVRVQSAVADSRWSQGDYELAVTFSESEQTMETLAKGVLDNEKPQKSFDLYSAKSQLVNFQLATPDSKPTSSGAVVALSIYNDQGRLVFRAVAKPGDTVTDKTVMLGVGKYKIVVDVLAAGKKGIPEVEFAVNATMISSDAGPLPNNPIGNPATGPGGTFPYVYPNNVTSTRPMVVMPPLVTKGPVISNPPVIPPLTWQQMMLNYAWFTGV